MKLDKIFSVGALAVGSFLVGADHFSVIPAAQSSFKVVIFDLGEVAFRMPRSWELPEAEQERLLQEHPELKKSVESKNLHRDIWNHILPVVSPGMTPIDADMLKILPCFMANWLTGMTQEQGRQVVHDYLEQSYYSEGMKKVWKSMLDQFLHPERFVDLLGEIEFTTRLAKLLKEQGYQLYVLSNWDDLSFSSLKDRYPHFFDLFDGIVISGQEKMGKPNGKIYTCLLARYNLNPRECIFIDDVERNLAPARELGIQGILMDSEESVLRELEKIKVIQFVAASS